METQCKTNENLCKTYEPPMENIVKTYATPMKIYGTHM